MTIPVHPSTYKTKKILMVLAKVILLFETHIVIISINPHHIASAFLTQRRRQPLLLPKGRLGPPPQVNTRESLCLWNRLCRCLLYV